ncbi:cysteine methyltransferase [Candidatus Gracilibacteria bacterium]|nr:cysteine methyltransferase [Candidatus Gracilibacteria bacterium]
MNTYEEIYAIVRRIPLGRVTNYGTVAALAGYPRHARMAGYALHALSDQEASEVPWWRVVNAGGFISNAYQPQLQRELLETEGVVFDSEGRIDRKRFWWDGAGAARVT